MRSFHRVIVALLLTVAASGASAVARELPHALTPAEMALVHSICLELLTSREALVTVPVKGAPGLRVLSEIGREPEYAALLAEVRSSSGPEIQEHELVSAARYAAVLARHGQSLVLVPSIDGLAVPGFDGVVLSARGKPIANFTLKTLLEAKSTGSIFERAAWAARRAKYYSRSLSLIEAALSLEVSDSGSYQFKGELTVAHARKARDFVKKLSHVFGVTSDGAPSRPTRVVLDLETAELLLPGKDLKLQLRRIILRSRGEIESITLLKGDKVVVIR